MGSMNAIGGADLVIGMKPLSLGFHALRGPFRAFFNRGFSPSRLARLMTATFVAPSICIAIALPESPSAHKSRRISSLEGQRGAANVAVLW